MMRSLLFTPADSPRKLEKALTSGADAVIVDLEDAIAPDRKNAARTAAATFLRDAQTRASRPRLLVRINGLHTGLIDGDLDAIVAAKPDAILLPKAEGGASIIHADAKLTAREALAGLPQGHIGIVAQAIESAAGLFAIGTLKDSSPRLRGMTWGPEDLSVELGARANRDDDGALTAPYRLARSLCLFGAAAAGVQAIETVYVNFRDTEGLRHDTEMACRDGFTGRLAIHPAQVPIINAIFTPSAEAIAHAHAVVEAFRKAGGAGVVAIDGVMFDQPHLLRAERLLARVQTTESSR